MDISSFIALSVRRQLGLSTEMLPINISLCPAHTGREDAALTSPRVEKPQQVDRKKLVVKKLLAREGRDQNQKKSLSPVSRMKMQDLHMNRW